MEINKYFLLLGLSLFVACGTPAQPPVVPPVVPPPGQSTVTLTTSDSNPVVGSSVTFKATATGQITKLELLEGTTVLETVDDAVTLETAVPMGAVGKRSFTARATDAAGVIATSAVVEVDTKAAGVGAAEITASLGASNLNPFLGSSVKFSAAALPADQIKKLELLAGTTVLKTVDDTASFELNVVMDSVGAKSFTTRATSKSGVVVSSAVLNVVVKEAVTLTASTLKPFEGGDVTFTVTNLLGQFASAKLELVEKTVILGGQITEVVVATKTSSPLTSVLVMDSVGTRKFFARVTNRTGQVFKSGILDVVTVSPPQVALGDNHTCVLLTSGDVRCWGNNQFGQLGLGNTNNLGDDEAITSVPPIKFPVGFKVKQITAGNDHTCALSEAGTVICWGRNDRGQLGLGDTTTRGDKSSNTPEKIGLVGIAPVKTIFSSYSGDHNCAILVSEAVKCWGANDHGELGIGNVNDNGNAPGEIEQNAPISLGSSPVKHMALGFDHTCALLANNALHCWGNHQSGTLGNGDVFTGPFGDEPNELPSSRSVSITDATDIVAGRRNNCVTTTTQNVRCWGINDKGQLGYGNPNNIGDDELPGTAGFVNLGAPIKQISSGNDSLKGYFCVLLIDNTVRCWGSNASGQLGLGNTTDIGDNETPIAADKVSVNTDSIQGKILKIFSGGGHNCVLFASGNIKCWGRSEKGQLGYGNKNTIGDNEFPSSVGVVPLF
jgi:alpha-tubulin suppressor-like RCC1 family protein